MLPYVEFGKGVNKNRFATTIHPAPRCPHG